MSREAHFSFVAIEYKQFLVDAGYMVTESENFPRLCLVEVTDRGLEALFSTLQVVAHKIDADLFIIDKALAVDDDLDEPKSHEAMWAQALVDKEKIDQAFCEVAELNAKTKNAKALH